jgi:hypothetical protein
MPICFKCKQKEGAVNFTTVMNGAQKTVCLCMDCASLGGFQDLDLKKLEVLSIDGKTCGFCDRAAVFGISGVDGSIYWCSICCEEYEQTLKEILFDEHPDLMWRNKISGSFFELLSDPEFRSWSQIVSKKAIEIMRRRKPRER